MVHAGWRGLAAGVLRRVFARSESSAVRTTSSRSLVPARAPAATRSARRCTRAFGGAHRRDATPDLAAIACDRLRAAGVTRVEDAGVCTICDERFFSHRREGARAGRQAGVAWAPGGADRRPARGRVHANLAQVREEIVLLPQGRARPRGGGGVGRDQVCSAADLPDTRRGRHLAGGENRAQDLQEKVAAHGELFAWDFIGQLQSRKVRADRAPCAADPLCRDRVGAARVRPPSRAGPPWMEILVEVNIAARARQGGRLPEQIRRIHLSARPFGAGPDDDAPLRPDPGEQPSLVRALRELADDRGLSALSMGTSQDYSVAVVEGATIVRIGTRLYGLGPSRTDGASRQAGARFLTTPQDATMSRETRPPGENSPNMAFSDSWHRALVYFGLAEEYHDDYAGRCPARGGDRGSLPRAAQRPPPAPPPR